MNTDQLRQTVRRNWREMSPRLRFYAVLSLGLLVLACILFWNRIFINIYPGEAGVVWKRFLGGTELRQIYSEGFHIIPPWDKMYVYNTRVQQVTGNFVALSKDGLSISFDVSIRYQPRVGELPTLHQQVGPDYVETIVKPTVQSEIRSIVGKFKPEEIYGTQGFLLETIRQGAMLSLAERYVILDDLLVKSVRLPERVQEAIENKLRAEQASLEWNYRIEREMKEAQRKEIEGVGIERFQRAVSQKDFAQYLKFRGIEATVALATSNNAKVVLIGNKDGLPLILNLSDETGAPAAATPAGDSTPPAGIEAPPQPASPRTGLVVPRAPEIPPAPTMRPGENPSLPSSEQVNDRNSAGQLTAREAAAEPAEPSAEPTRDAR